MKRQLIMTIGVTANGWELTKEMVENSLGTFANIPIIYNKKEEYKDYTKGFEDYFKNNQAVGVICSIPNIAIECNNVYADIIMMDDYQYLWKGKFDNWCLEPSKDKKSFKLLSIEVF
jgi:hypothetical protein